MDNLCPRCQLVFSDQSGLFSHLEHGCRKPIPKTHTTQRSGMDTVKSLLLGIKEILFPDSYNSDQVAGPSKPKLRKLDSVSPGNRF